MTDNLVIKQQISYNNIYYKQLDELAIKSRILFNLVVKEFNLNESKFDLRNRLRTTNEYKLLPSKVSNQVIFQVYSSFKTYKSNIKLYNKGSNKINGKPKPPKEKLDHQRNKLIYDSETLSYKDNKIKLSGTNILVDYPLSIKGKIKRIEIIRKKGCYEIIICYGNNNKNKGKQIRELPKFKPLNKDYYLGIDLGVKNIVSITSNKPDFKPIIIKNNYLNTLIKIYNNKINQLQEINKQNNNITTKLLQRTLRNFENKKVDIYHKLSNYLIKICIDNQIGNIVVGYNEYWKQNANIGKLFQSIGFYILIDKIDYKSKEFGIEMYEIEESYTSRCSFMDIEVIRHNSNYKGIRKTQGQFITNKGIHIHADINASYNILRKKLGDSWIIRDKTGMASKDYTANPVKIYVDYVIRHKTKYRLDDLVNIF